jgi:hypothetical protein
MVDCGAQRQTLAPTNFRGFSICQRQSAAGVSTKQHFLDKRFEKPLPKIDQLIDNENSVFSSSAFA